MNQSGQRQEGGVPDANLDLDRRADLEAILARGSSCSQMQRGYAEGIAPRARALKASMPDIVNSIAGAGVRILTVAAAGSLVLLLAVLGAAIGEGYFVSGLLVWLLLLCVVAFASFAPACRTWLFKQRLGPVKRRWDHEYLRTRKALRSTSISELIADHDTWIVLLGSTKSTGLGRLAPPQVPSFEDALVYAAWHFESLEGLAAGQREQEGSVVLHRHMQLNFFRVGKGNKLAYASDRVEPYARLAAICDFFADDFIDLEAGFESPRLQRSLPTDAGSLRKS
ncbi:hypothetical protein IT575_05365 [bacterium]|nr:hypothetical protein [bacterium]